MNSKIASCASCLVVYEYSDWLQCTETAIGGAVVLVTCASTDRMSCWLERFCNLASDMYFSRERACASETWRDVAPPDDLLPPKHSVSIRGVCAHAVLGGGVKSTRSMPPLPSRFCSECPMALLFVAVPSGW